MFLSFAYIASNGSYLIEKKLVSNIYGEAGCNNDLEEDIPLNDEVCDETTPLTKQKLVQTISGLLQDNFVFSIYRNFYKRVPTPPPSF